MAAESLFWGFADAIQAKLHEADHEPAYTLHMASTMRGCGYCRECGYFKSRDVILTLFTYVAEQYKNCPLSDEGDVAAAPTPSSRDGATKNRLSDICHFKIAALPAQQSGDHLDEELRRYFKFEGGQGDLNNPLVWYKVRLQQISQQILLLTNALEKQWLNLSYCTNGAGLLSHSSNKCFR
jgi:hypothetical protein